VDAVACGCLTDWFDRVAEYRRAATIATSCRDEDWRIMNEQASAAEPHFGGAEKVTSAVAVDVLPLRPSGVGPLAAAVEEVELWPAFALVLSEPVESAQGTASPLFDALKRPLGDVVVLAAYCDWSIADHGLAFLDLVVRVSTPIQCAIRILVPAGPVLRLLESVARGAMMAITTRERATRLTGEPDIRRVLREVVLLSCPKSTHLAELARGLRIVDTSLS
jgi:hypothetical protein